MAPGAGVRWCESAGMAGGALLTVFYAALECAATDLSPLSKRQWPPRVGG